MGFADLTACVAGASVVDGGAEIPVTTVGPADRSTARRVGRTRPGPETRYVPGPEVVPMGLQQELGYEVRPANAFQRAMQRVASWAPISRLFQKTLHVVDRPLYRWSKGRVTVPGLVAGLPVILVTTTGARSGLPRSMPLLGVPMGDDVAVIGSNFGTERTPGWVVNLEADPAATVTWRDRSVPVVARRATPEETERAFEVGSVYYSGFPAYRERAAHREIRVFVLEPAS